MVIESFSAPYYTNLITYHILCNVWTILLHNSCSIRSTEFYFDEAYDTHLVYILSKILLFLPIFKCYHN